MAKVAVIGLGRFGSACAKRLYDQGAEVLAIDRSRARIEELKDGVTAAIACDATVRSNLTAYDVGNMDAVVVATASNFETSVLVTLHCHEMGVPRVVVKALNALQSRVLHEVGADQVVMPEEEMGERLADHVLRESIVDFVELPDVYTLRRLAVPEDWYGKSLADLALLPGQRLNVVQIVRTAETAASGDEKVELGYDRIPLPSGETVFLAGDRMDVIGPDEVLQGLSATPSSENGDN